MSLYEVDQPEVIDWKQSFLTNLGHTSTAQHHCVGIDLRQDWPTALRQKGFDDAKPTAWIVEGLFLGYLPPDAHDDILDAISALSAPGSRIAADHLDVQGADVVGETMNSVNDIWRKHDPDLNLRNLTFPGPRPDAALYLAEHGWTAHNLDVPDLFRAANRPVPAALSGAANRPVPAATDLSTAAEFVRMLSGIRN